MGMVPTYDTPTVITKVGYLATYIYMFKSVVEVKLINYCIAEKIDGH